MSANDPDQLRREVDATRRTLSDDVNDLKSTGRPGEVAKAQVGRAAESAQDLAIRWKDRIMGTLSRDDSPDAPGTGAGGTGNPVTERTQGAPIAAGVIAAAAGWLAGALVPSTRQESRAADAVMDRAAGPVEDEIRATVQESAERLQQPAQDAAEAVRSTAAGAVENVRDDVSQATQHVKDSAQESVDTVKDADEQRGAQQR